MKLDSATSIYNMGDTSIRVNQLVDINKVILKALDSFWKSESQWERNTSAQEEFYKSFLNKIVDIEKEDGIELFRDFIRAKNYSAPSTNKIGFRGRTLTNALVKTGLIDSKRKISQVGNRYLNGNIKPADVLEELLNLDIDNLLYFRQFLKLRIYSHNSDSFFYNFRFAIKFLNRYSDIPKNNFFKILESINPNQPEDELEKIIDLYSDVADGNLTFEQFYTSYFSKVLNSPEQLLEAQKMFTEKDFTDENFIKLFPNRDSSDTSLLYKKFLLKIIEIQDEEIDITSQTTISDLYTLSRNDKIKKAFGAGKIPINISKKDTRESFIENNKDNPLVSNNHFDKYLQFIFSKHNDLIREYSDMGRRAFQVTGVINFNNGLVNLNNPWLFSSLLKIIDDRFNLSGTSDYSLYEENLDSEWFDDLSLTEIFSITENEIELIRKDIAIKFKINNIDNIATVIHEKQEKEYRSFVAENFPKETVVRILSNIQNRNDDEVFKLVTDAATIPTIYEYILTIAWFHISNNKFKLSEAFQVTLDGNKLPLSHRGGGAGDIEIFTTDYSLLIEATLMNMNTQKRGELEPVIRHSTNFFIDRNNSDCYTIFIANELDNNVINIFRAMQFVELSGTYGPKTSIRGLSIFALTTSEIIEILNRNIMDTHIINSINSTKDFSPNFISIGWREKIINKILKEA